MRGVTVNTRNVRSIFRQVMKHADNAAQAMSIAIDFELYWYHTEEGKSAIDFAHKLNQRGSRQLDIEDKRTRGGKWFAAVVAKAKKRAMRKQRHRIFP